MAKGFQAEVNGWVQKSEKRIEVVFKQSAQAVVNAANKPIGSGGNMPVDTSFLRASLQSQIGAVPGGDISESRTVGQMESELLLTIAGAKVGQVLFFAWGANYARRLHYGFSGQDSLGRNYNQKGHFWVTKAAAKWQTIVRRVSAEAKSRFP